VYTYIIFQQKWSNDLSNLISSSSWGFIVMLVGSGLLIVAAAI
jgi:hypothetical protein